MRDPQLRDTPTHQATNTISVDEDICATIRRVNPKASPNHIMVE